MAIYFNWFNEPGVQNTISAIYKVIGIIRIVVPIALIVMTSLDIAKKVIDPEDKEGQKKIMNRAIAALIVFLLPTIISLLLKLANIEIPNINTNPTPTPEPTVKPQPTTDTSKVSCSSGMYTPAYSSTCNTCLEDYYCPGGIFEKNSNTASGLYYCGDGYTSLKGSTKATDCYKKPDPTPEPTIAPTPSSNPVNPPSNWVNNLKIVNCPNLDTIYYSNDVISLESNIPSTYNGSIKWEVINGGNDINLITVSNNLNAKVLLSNVTKEGVATVSLKLDNQMTTCSFKYGVKNVAPTPSSNPVNPPSNWVNNLKIVNCPGTDTTYYSGDRIVLESNIPSTYNGSIKWNVSNGGNNLNIITVSNNRNAMILLSNVTKEGYATVSLKLDSQMTTCSFKYGVKGEQTNTVTCSEKYYLPASTSSCSYCPINYYCPGGTYNLGVSSNQGLFYCGNGYTSPAGSSSARDCTRTPIQKQRPVVEVSPTSLEISVGEYKSYQIKVVSSVPGKFYNEILTTNCLEFYQQDFSVTEINGSYRQYNQNYGIPIKAKSACENGQIRVTYKPNDTNNYEEVVNIVNVRVPDPSTQISLASSNMYYHCGTKVNGYQPLSVYYAPQGLSSQGSCFGECVNLTPNTDYTCACTTSSDIIGEKITYRCTGKGNYRGTKEFVCYGKKSDSPPVCTSWY